MVCKECQLNPVYKLPNKTLCKSCFISYFEKKVFKTIKKFNLFELNDKLIIATSGGKDSQTVLYLVHKFLKKKKLEKNIIALAVDEGIGNYRDETLNCIKEFCKKLDVPLKIVSFQEHFGKTLKESMNKLEKQNKNISPCNICGTFRRQILNFYARKLKGTKLVTGHNLDDEAQAILLNIFKNNYKVLPRMGPKNGITQNKLFIQRVKPLYMVSEKEVKLYTILKGFNVRYDECPYSTNRFRGNIGKTLNQFENDIGGVKSSVVKFYLEIQESLREKHVKDFGKTIKYCKICSEPSENEICNACKLQKIVSKNI